MCYTPHIMRAATSSLLLFTYSPTVLTYRIWNLPSRNQRGRRGAALSTTHPSHLHATVYPSGTGSCMTSCMKLTTYSGLNANTHVTVACMAVPTLSNVNTPCSPINTPTMLLHKDTQLEAGTEKIYVPTCCKSWLTSIGTCWQHF